MPKIKTSDEAVKVLKTPLFDVDMVREVREISGACNQSLLMKIAAKEFVENHPDADDIAAIVTEQREGIRMIQLEAELNAYRQKQKGK